MTRVVRWGAPLLLALAVTRQPQAQEPAGSKEWPVYGGNGAGTRHSPLTQITRDNVGSLSVAWSYDTGETGGFQVSPIVVGGVLYATTPTHRTVAIDAATGALRWAFDSGIKGSGPNRGVAYWARANDRRVYAAVNQFLYALDAGTGRVVTGFGTGGRIDLRENLGRDPARQSVRLTSPPVVYKDLLILGGRVSEGDGASPGYVRAYDAATGRLRWTFRTIPSPGEPGHETWSPDAWKTIGGANNWPGMAVDASRGLVFVPTGSAAPDFYGGGRLGDNLFSNCLLALKADTGERAWHFQFVHHDIWDRDPPSPPTLVTVTRDGRRIDAVAQTTKQGYVFVFDRESGVPLFPIEERPFPSSDVAGERTAPTQPIPLTPAPFARQLLTRDMLTTRTPEAHAWAVKAFDAFRSEGQFLPFTIGRDTVVFPGFDGGAEWGGSAYDPASSWLYVNANDVAWTGALAPAEDGTTARSAYLKDCALCHRDDLKGTPPSIPTLVSLGDRRTQAEVERVIRQGAGRMPGFPALPAETVAALATWLRAGGGAGPSANAATEPDAPRSPFRFTGYKKFLDPDGYPAIAPPWGTLTAIDLNTGAHAWQIPLGEYPELAAAGVKPTGTENYGGPIVTASGVLFIGATNFDRKFRAFDARTGGLLWEATLPFSGNATPVTYEAGGRQFVVIAAGGAKGRPNEPSGGVFVAFALPR